MSRWRWPLVLLSATLSVAIAVAANQILAGGVWSWPWIPVSLVLAVTGASVTDILTRPAPAIALRLCDRRGRPPLLADVSAEDLGVHPTRFGRRGASPYVARAVDTRLEQALGDDRRRVVVVHGQKLAGTTRTLARAATAVLAGHRVLVYRPDPRQRLADLIDDARRWAGGPGAVLWLDEITAAHLAELDHDLVDRLPAGLRLCLPCHTAQVTGFSVPQHLARVLREDAAVVELDVLSTDERARLRAAPAYRELAPAIDAGAPLLLGRLLVTLDELDQLLRPTGEDGVDRVALLRAVTDWHRAGVPTRLRRRDLADLHDRYRREIAGTDKLGPSGLARALKAARAHRPPLVERIRDHYVPHPLLAAVTGDPVSDALWDHAEHALSEDDRRHLGLVALDRSDPAHAYALLRTVPDAALDAQVVVTIAEWLNANDDVEPARHWYERAAGSGDPVVSPNALYGLATLEFRVGDLDRARHWYLRTIEAREPDTAARATYCVGLIARDQGDTDGAVHWLRLAIGTGHPVFAPKAMLVLGDHAMRRGEVEQAREWLGRAIASGEAQATPRALNLLGQLEHQAGNLTRAREPLQRALTSGHPTMVPSSMRWLGEVDLSAGRTARARSWFLRAVDSGDPDAAAHSLHRLGTIASADDPAQARRWFLRAIDTGRPDVYPNALYDLGLLEGGLGSLHAARHCYELAAATGHPTITEMARHNLGVVADELGETDEARRAYREAIGCGVDEPVARGLFNLAWLEADQGDTDQARTLFQAAVETGYRPVADQARRAIAELNQRLTDLAAATEFVERGSWRWRYDGRASGGAS
ncbi:hypothetical protein BLA60_15685 [Actinophytocola xinjiangensis]|uniref:Tetratricopeptide repeat protein n=1 Tax=Actinophytocola xinjiangensis TaxID=485602 RepID=A0A7Z0WN11_9PSEU|nr:tetratricopeptide repeat protein [Actinophytocola xinjiangensis]OLF10614.1 hypothetical protein BLA60_15685 [Actinophytocola xinjiangensis]